MILLGNALCSSTGSYYAVGYDPSIFSLLAVITVFRRLSTSPCLPSTCFANNDVLCITSLQDS